MCIYNADFDNPIILEEDLHCFKVVFYDKKYYSQFPPYLRAFIIKKQNRGDFFEYKLNKKKRSSFKNTFGIFCHIEYDLLREYCNKKHLKCLVPKGSKVVYGKSKLDLSFNDIICCEEIIPIEEI